MTGLLLFYHYYYLVLFMFERVARALGGRGGGRGRKWREND